MTDHAIQKKKVRVNLFRTVCPAVDKSNSSYTVIRHWGEPVFFYSTVNFTSLLCLKGVVYTDEKMFLKNKNMKTRDALEALQSNPRQFWNI